jgi:hypothetical protein
MSRKSLAIILVLVVVIGLAIVYFTYNGLLNTSYGGYTKIQLYRTGSYIGTFSQKVGDYSYFFAYYPDTIYPTLNLTANGKLQIWRQDAIGSNDFSLKTDTQQNYLGMTFIITEVKPDYVIVMVKPTA